MANRNKEEPEEKKGVSELWINREIRAVCKILKYLYSESILRMMRKSMQNHSRPDRTSIPSKKKHLFFSTDAYLNYFKTCAIGKYANTFQEKEISSK